MLERTELSLGENKKTNALEYSVVMQVRILRDRKNRDLEENLPLWVGTWRDVYKTVLNKD